MGTFDELKARYPTLIPPGFSFECGKGWADILSRYFDEAAAALQDTTGFRLHNVQSRFGRLTIDASLAPGMPDESVEAIEKASMRAEGRSNRWCESCGQAGKPREGDWISAACDEHASGAKAVPLDVVVFTHRGTRYVYDEEADDVMVLTPEGAAAIPWLEDP